MIAERNWSNDLQKRRTARPLAAADWIVRMEAEAG
jgi:hypothetical protein